MKVQQTDDLLVSLDQMKQTKIEESVLETKPRDFFRGSEVGHCSNQINFRRRGTPTGEIGVSKARFLEDGHLHQAVLSGELRAAGIKVTGEEEESLEEINYKGITFTIRAHKDGTVRVGKEEQLLEVKSVKENRFQEILKTHDVSSYYDQIQMYMYLYQYKRCKLLIVDRNNSLRLEYTVSEDQERMKFLIRKLTQIEKDLRENKQSSRDYPRNSKECGWCPYFEKCWGVERGRYAKGEQQEKAVEVEGKKEVHTWEVAVDLYRKYSRLSKEAKTYKEEADSLMSILLTRFKATKLHGKGGSIVKSITVKQVPDKSTINDLIVKGEIPVETVESVSLRYNLEKEDED